MKPPFAYYGGKSGMAPLIASLLPPHRNYIEPFFGSGAVLFAKKPAVNEIVNDVDGSVVTFFRVLRERPDELEAVCALTPYARDEFTTADLAAGDLDELELARRFWVRVNQSFAKTARACGGWSVTTARNQGTPTTVLSRIGRFAACAERLRRVTIENCDGADLIERMAHAETAVYVDCPYPSESRLSTGDYRHDMGSEEDHRRLAKVLHATAAGVVLSGYPCPLYDELYDGWWSIDVATTAHSSNLRGPGRSGRIERIWSNRELDDGRLPLELVR